MHSATLAALNMIFFGTQPTLTQVPPRRPASTNATLAPCAAARRAAAIPPLPPPITTKSNTGIRVPEVWSQSARMSSGGVAESGLRQPSLLLDELADGADAFAWLQVGEDERPLFAHLLGIAIHDLERGADVGRQIG